MNTLTALALTAAVVSSLAPMGAPTAHAQSRDELARYYESYRERAESTTSRSSSQRSRYSSSIEREIKKLDDDAVKKIPVPVLFGTTLGGISPNFGDPRGGGTRSHEGEDIMAAMGTPVASPTDAVVVRTGTGASSGITVTTANPGGETFVYMHLSAIAEGVKTGTVLKEGQILGFVGDTGNAKGGAPHLHFEIRKGKTATDPYPRLSRTFSTDERIDAVAAYLRTLDDSDAEEFAEDLVQGYRSTFVSARSAGTELPKEIEDALGSVRATATAAGTRDLTLGSSGDDVTLLQTRLIEANVGAAARALKSAGATGYFGSMTQAALREYQAAKGISPASGYYGPLTRAALALS